MTAAMLLQLMSRPGADAAASEPASAFQLVRALVADNHETPARRAGLARRAIAIYRTLRAAGLGYEIIPGVPSACAAAAAAGIPLTRRLTARRVQFITGADVTGALPTDLNWPALADPGVKGIVITSGKKDFAGGMDLNVIAQMRAGGAQAIFDGVMMMHKVLRKIVLAGMDPKT